MIMKLWMPALFLVCTTKFRILYISTRRAMHTDTGSKRETFEMLTPGKFLLLPAMSRRCVHGALRPVVLMELSIADKCITGTILKRY